jgi:acetyl/propionyl-CoA carboxylase alpha subunit
MGIESVAVFSDPDAGEPHTLEADESIRLPGANPSDTYLNIDAVLAAASQTGADAIHPGYGFLSENPTFARAIVEAGIKWIGPSAEAIEIMGSKVESKKLMSSAGVPTIPGVEITDLSVPKSAAEALGFPIVVKASAGGGGKGMRVVGKADDLAEAIESSRREAAGAFGDETVFIEKYLETPRHIEIQVFADNQGNTVSLFERECSIQRRHQKIIEESPSVAVDDSLREIMGSAAVEAARAVDYVGAGTVEFLFENNDFYFLEMNTRLQVEHPVTEAITGLDLVRLQIEVADGQALPDSALFPTITGHAIEARLYAEDPENGFLPVTGAFHKFEFESEVRVDSGIESGSEVTVHYDPMLAKVIAHGATRAAAISVLADSLRRARIHGSQTNRALLVRILESDEFAEGDTDTTFIGRHDLADLAAPLATQKDEERAAIAAALADQADGRATARVLSTIPSGFRNLTSQQQLRSYAGRHSSYNIAYSVKGPNVSLEDGDVDVSTLTADTAEYTSRGVSYQFHIARYGDIRHVDTPSVPTRLVEVPRFPDPTTDDDDAGSLHAPMPGQIIRVDVLVDDVVKEGQALVVLEAMKMEHTIRAPFAGRVTNVACEDGDQVEANAVLAIIEGLETT